MVSCWIWKSRKSAWNMMIYVVKYTFSREGGGGLEDPHTHTLIRVKWSHSLKKFSDFCEEIMSFLKKIQSSVLWLAAGSHHSAPWVVRFPWYQSFYNGGYSLGWSVDGTASFLSTKLENTRAVSRSFSSMQAAVLDIRQSNSKARDREGKICLARYIRT